MEEKITIEVGGRKVDFFSLSNSLRRKLRKEVEKYNQPKKSVITEPTYNEGTNVR